MKKVFLLLMFSALCSPAFGWVNSYFSYSEEVYLTCFPMYDDSSDGRHRLECLIDSSSDHTSDIKVPEAVSINGMNYASVANDNELYKLLSDEKRIGGNTLYGKYKEGEKEVWFVTDEQEVIHYLPQAPRQGGTFKNDPLIRKANGKIIYIGERYRLYIFDFSDNTDEEVVNAPFSNFVVISRNTGDYVFCVSESTAIQGVYKMSPDGSFSRVPLTPYAAEHLFVDASGDIGYLDRYRFKRMEVDENGKVTNAQATSIPVAMAEFYESFMLLTVPPRPFSFSYQPSYLDRIGNILFVENYLKVFIIGGRVSDFKEVIFFNYNQNQKISSCMNDKYIYVSNGVKIVRRSIDNLEAEEYILDDVEIKGLDCLEDGSLRVKKEYGESYIYSP